MFPRHDKLWPGEKPGNIEQGIVLVLFEFDRGLEYRQDRLYRGKRSGSRRT